MAGTRVVEYTWVGRIEIEVKESGNEGDQEALDKFNGLLMEESPQKFMDLQDENEEVVEEETYDEEESE
tara:strand:+ start:470 stop:676 length:207 start_codon:yes stop_codon:yes gene_type:complete